MELCKALPEFYVDYFSALLVAIVFGAACMPFLVTAEGFLSLEKSQEIGHANILRILLVFGVLTALFSFFSFEKKRYRLTSLALIAIWGLIDAVALLPPSTDSQSDAGGIAEATAPIRCSRADPYPMRPEFQRALSLIEQRLVEGGQSDDPALRAYEDLGLRNCLDIQYAKPENELGEAEGQFVIGVYTSIDHLPIFVSPRYYNGDDLLTAVLLSHEVSHAASYSAHLANGVPHLATSEDCYMDEIVAFHHELVFMGTLNKEEVASLSQRRTEGVQAVKNFAAAIQSAKGNDVLTRIENMVKDSKVYQAECERN